MACTHPITAYEVIGKYTKRGKALIMFKKPQSDPYREIEIACGQCLLCRIDKAKEWQKRIIAESKLHQDNWFVTLTYNETVVPKKDVLKINLDEETGEVLEAVPEKKMTLVKKDVTDFKKRLLEHYRTKLQHTGIRFFYCGEYGPKTDRPHYHIIFFNLPIPDLKPYKLNKQGQMMFNSKLLEEKWGLGFVVIGSLTYESAGYVARYVLKKQTKGVIYDGREKEFIEMSRNPGIGHDYYAQNKEQLYKNDSMLIPKEFSNSYWSKPPRYFDKMFEEEEKERFYDIKIHRRKRAQTARDVEQFNKSTSLWPEEQRELKERQVAVKMVNLTRDL